MDLEIPVKVMSEHQAAEWWGLAVLLWAGVGLAVLALVGLGVWWWMRPGAAVPPGRQAGIKPGPR